MTLAELVAMLQRMIDQQPELADVDLILVQIAGFPGSSDGDNDG